MASSYQQLVQEQLGPQGAHSKGSDEAGPMNLAAYEDVRISDGGGTSLDTLFPPEPVVHERPCEDTLPPPPQLPLPLPRDPRGYVPVCAPVPPKSPAVPEPQSVLDPQSRAALLVCALYYVVASNAFQDKLAEILPEIFLSPGSFVTYLFKGLVVGGLYYLVQKYMVKQCA